MFSTQEIVHSSDNPGWNPKSGQYKMILYGQAYIEGLLIDQPGYIIGAFGPGGDDDCRGLSEIIQFKEYWLFYLKIESNDDSTFEKIYFKIFNTSNNRTTDMESTIFFQKDQLIEKDLDIPFKINTVYPTQGLVGKKLTVEVEGKSFTNTVRGILSPVIRSDDRVIRKQKIIGVESMDINGLLAYMAVGLEGFSIYQITSNYKLEKINSFEILDGNEPLYINGIHVDGSKLYLSSENGLLFIYRINNPKLPEKITQIKVSETINEIQYKGKYLYILSDMDGLKRMNPEDESIETVFENSFYDFDVIDDNTILLLTDKGETLQISVNESNVFEIKNLNINNINISICVGKKYVYIVDKKCVLRIYDTGNLIEPLLEKKLSYFTSYRMYYFDQYLYIMKDSFYDLQYLYILNANDPSNLIEYPVIFLEPEWPTCREDPPCLPFQDIFWLYPNFSRRKIQANI